MVMHRLRIAILLLALAFACPAPGRAASLPPDAERVARDFITAFSVNDRESVTRLLPKAAASLYGPSPFRKMPQIIKPRADGRVAAIDFDGPMTDSNLPSRGIIVLRLVEEGNAKSWRVRQIYWFNELPPEADLPDKSPTAADRRQEPLVRRAAMDFISAWLKGKWEVMEGLTFQWWKVHRKPPKWVTLGRVDLEAKPTTLGGIRVDFEARLKLAGIIPRTVHGNIWLVQEDGAWRVRPLTFSLLF